MPGRISAAMFQRVRTFLSLGFLGCATAALVPLGCGAKITCQEHLNDCLDSPLQSKPGSLWNHSRCLACFDQCRDGNWPRRRIAEYILRVADAHHPPFEVCRQAWNDVVRLGFSNTYIECVMTRYFAECCRYDEKPEEGLAVLEPLIAELERGIEEARATLSSTEFHEYHLEPLLKLRDALLAQQRGEEIPGRSTRRLDEAAPPTSE